MSSEKIRGIVIREGFSGEADKFLTIFAKDRGKISVFAKGARNTKSKFLASSSLFTYGDFLIRTVTKTPTLLSADVIESFYGIRADIAPAAYASYFVELIDRTMLENVEENNALLLLLKALQHLAKDGKNVRSTGIVFQLRLLDILGYRPEQEEIKDYSLSLPSLAAVEYILSAELGKVFRIIPEQKYMTEIESFLETYMEYHIDTKFKSYGIIKDLVLTN